MYKKQSLYSISLNHTYNDPCTAIATYVQFKFTKMHDVLLVLLFYTEGMVDRRFSCFLHILHKFSYAHKAVGHSLPSVYGIFDTVFLLQVIVPLVCS